jgi:hypothetical protein
MRRNRNLTVESLEGKMLLAVGVGVHVLPAPQFQTLLPHAPTVGTGFAAFATTPITQTAPQNHLPHGPTIGTGFAAF